MWGLTAIDYIKEQQTSGEYVINKCFPCIDYSTASHSLCIQENRGDKLFKNNKNNEMQEKTEEITTAISAFQQ